MKRLTSLLLPFLLFFALLRPALSDQLIVEPDEGRAPLMEAIQNSQQLYLVMYGLTDQRLLHQLVQQKIAGKTIKIILEHHPYKAEGENSKAIAALKKYHIDWKGKLNPPRLIHQKTMILDAKKAIVMTFNFSFSAFKNQRNFALIIDDPERVKTILSLFLADWNNEEKTGDLSSEVIISPLYSRPAILKLLREAKQHIQIYAQSLTDYRINGALAQAARKGVQVQILTSKVLPFKQAAYFNRAGIEVHYSKNYYIHAKAIIIDSKQALLGSTNLTAASLDDNRELSIRTQDAMVLRKLLSIFSQDWRDSSSY